MTSCADCCATCKSQGHTLRQPAKAENANSKNKNTADSERYSRCQRDFCCPKARSSRYHNQRSHRGLRCFREKERKKEKVRTKICYEERNALWKGA